jgi:hypothetical protein
MRSPETLRPRPSQIGHPKGTPAKSSPRRPRPRQSQFESFSPTERNAIKNTQYQYLECRAVSLKTVRDAVRASRFWRIRYREFESSASGQPQTVVTVAPIVASG